MGRKNLLQALSMLFCLQIFAETCNAAVFKQGRYKDGFLRSPNIKYDAELPPDMWFRQKLDHFNPQDQTNWQQVGIHFFSSCHACQSIFLYQYSTFSSQEAQAYCKDTHTSLQQRLTGPRSRRKSYNQVFRQQFWNISIERAKHRSFLLVLTRPQFIRISAYFFTIYPHSESYCMILIDSC